MVTSTGSGLSVPDWPLSYGMFFPPMVGGVFYEHGHRMAATLVGFFMLCLAVWLGFKEPRKWIRCLGFWALGAVICQGVLGGVTVLFFLPTPVSVAHGVLAQTFFILTIVIAYSLSVERKQREGTEEQTHPMILKTIFMFTTLIYIQLILGAIMRHSHSGLAVLDFPKMGGYWIPPFNQDMLHTLNDWRFDLNLDPVSMSQVVIHIIHRAWAVFILVMLAMLNAVGRKYASKNKDVMRTLLMLNSFVALQIILGIATILTQKSPQITSFHVVTGAATLGVSVLLLLRAAPLNCSKLK